MVSDPLSEWNCFRHHHSYTQESFCLSRLRCPKTNVSPCSSSPFRWRAVQRPWAKWCRLLISRRRQPPPSRKARGVVAGKPVGHRNTGRVSQRMLVLARGDFLKLLPRSTFRCDTAQYRSVATCLQVPRWEIAYLPTRPSPPPFHLAKKTAKD